MTSLVLVTWTYLVFCRNGYWRANERLAAHHTEVSDQAEGMPSVAILIPARNEESVLGQTLKSVANCDYNGLLAVIVIDDHSTDKTSDFIQAAVSEISSLKKESPPPLPTGWSGKLWALQHGFETLENQPPEFVLLIDADIALAPDTLSRLVTKAVKENRALVSLMARLDSRGLWGNFLIPAFIYFFQKLYPFPAANDPLNRLAAAAGGCALVRYLALKEIDGFRSFKDTLIDDCALARAIKGKPTRNAIWLGLANTEVTSQRDNRSLGSIWSMVERTAFTQLDYSWAKLLGTVMAMIMIYFGPFAALVWAVSHKNLFLTVASLVTIFLMYLSYRPTLRLYEKSTAMVVTLPLAAILYTGMTISSAMKHALNKGGAWKGRTYTKPQKN